MDNATIQEFLDEHDYDIRKTHNGRWIDQKCTMDVVCLVSDCIVEYTSGRNRKSFTVNDIWYNDYTVDNVQQIFSKPNPTEKASNEYDKYFGQPIKLLDAAGIIHGEKSGHGYVYSIVNQDLLEYISFRERNCYNFLCLYIEKVLRDSGIYRMFEYFFRLQDKRGTTSKRIVNLLRDAGAKEIHMRVSAPPFLHPCYYGTDIDSEENLIASHHSMEEIAEIIGADSLGYLPIEKLNKLAESDEYCAACFNGEYPTAIIADIRKDRFEGKLSERQNDK